MPLEDILVRIGAAALPAVADLVAAIAKSSDQGAAARKARAALEMDLEDAAVDAALDATLQRLAKE